MIEDAFFFQKMAAARTRRRFLLALPFWLCYFRGTLESVISADTKIDFSDELATLGIESGILTDVRHL